MDVEVIAENGDPCGESPLWDAERGRLLWTDTDRTVYGYAPSSRKCVRVIEDRCVAAFALHEGGGLVLAGEGLTRWLPDGGESVIAAEHDGRSLVFNDVRAAPGGRLYAGTMYWGEAMEEPGALYLFGPDGAAEVVDDGIELANGIALSPDDSTLYFADSAARRIFAYDVDGGTGRLFGKRVFAALPREEGLPDGLAVDCEGGVWCACWWGAQVLRFDTDGKVAARIPMPASQISSLAFGGGGLADLYVTSSAEPWESPLMPANRRADALGGSLYRLRPGVSGKPEHRTAL